MVGRSLARTTGEIRNVARAKTDAHGRLRERLVGLVVLTIVVDLVAAVLVLFFERSAPGTAITNYGDSIFWTSGQLLTVSSQLPNPLTTGGRIVDIFLEAYAISVVAALAASFTSFFHMSAQQDEAAS